MVQKEGGVKAMLKKTRSMPLSNAVSNVQKEGEGVKGVLKDVKKLHNLQNGTSLRLNIPKILSKSKVVFDLCLFG